MNRRLFAFVFIAAAIMFVSSFGGTTFAATPQSGSSAQYASITSLLNNTTIQWPNIPDLTGSGAYERINNGPWVKINAISGAGPVSPTVPTEGNTYGVEGGNASNNGINDAIVQVSFSQLASGESDSSWGSNAWSVQLNSNFFTGSNGLGDWIQFVLQNNLYNSSPSHRFARFGIWNVTNVYGSSQTYSNTSVYIPIQTLSTSTSYSIAGTYGNGEIESQLVISSPTNTYSYLVYQPDTYGLFGNWSSVSGTILGAGGLSEANFVHTTTETTTLQISAPIITNAFAQLDKTTGEENNLTPGSPSTTTLGNTYYVTTTSTK